MELVDKYAQNKLDVNQVLTLHGDLCPICFPPKRRKHFWQRWFAPGVSPVWLKLESLPLAIQVDAITSFLRSQTAAFGLTIPEVVPTFGSEDQQKTNGTKQSTPSPSLTKETVATG